MVLYKLIIVVVGAGLAGIKAIKKLAGTNAEIILIDRNSDRTFIPLLDRVATSIIPPEIVAYPIREYLRSIGGSLCTGAGRKD